MKRLLFISATLALTLSAKAEVRGYGGLTLDFTRAKKDGKVNHSSRIKRSKTENLCRSCMREESF